MKASELAAILVKFGDKPVFLSATDSGQNESTIEFDPVVMETTIENSITGNKFDAVLLDIGKDLN